MNATGLQGEIPSKDRSSGLSICNLFKMRSGGKVEQLGLNPALPTKYAINAAHRLPDRHYLEPGQVSTVEPIEIDEAESKFAGDRRRAARSARPGQEWV